MGAQAVRLSNVDIDNALKNRQFEVLFQPIFDLGNGALARMETFVRWRHPSLGMLPPGAFISFFESQGRMNELSRYVLDEAMSGYLKWRGNYGPGFSINLALTDLSDEALASHLTVLLREHDFPADAVTLECPMPPVTTDPVQAREQFEALRMTGARLAIEVRGRANDFLRNVDPFPFDEIKTGGAAILRFARTVRGPGLSAISELLDIANSANASITAVGVEDQASLSALRGLGFSAAQGNHLAKVGGLTDFRPVMVNKIRKLLDLEDLSSTELGELFRTGRSGQTMQFDQASDFDVNPDDDNPVQKGTLEEEENNEIASDAQKKVANISYDTDEKATAERARKKAAILAKKKGKDALRAEISARRKKLGLSASDTLLDANVSVPRDLQDRLASEFENAADEVGDDQSDGVQEEVTSSEQTGDTQFEQEVIEKNAASSSEMDLEDDLFAELTVPSDHEGATDGVDVERTEYQGGDAAISEIKGDSEVAVVAEPDVGSINNLDLPTSETETQKLVPEEPSSPSEENLTGENTSRSDSVSDSVSAPDQFSIPPGPSSPIPRVEKASRTAMAIGASRAYLSDVWYAAFNLHAVETIKTQSSADIEAAREKLTSNLVLFSIDEPEPTLEEKSSPTLYPGAEIETDIVEEDNLVFVSARSLEEKSFGLPEAPSGTNGIFGDHTESISDEILNNNDKALTSVSDNSQIDNAVLGEPINDEQSLIDESFIIADSVKKQSSRRKGNFLTRKYRIWPDHFWPRSWRRAWDRRQANKDFVRRARLRAEETLGGPESALGNKH